MFDTDRAVEALAHIRLARDGKHGSEGHDQGQWGALVIDEEFEPQLPRSYNDFDEDGDGLPVDPITNLPVGIPATACGTAFCMAGWITHLEGLPNRWTYDDSFDGKIHFDGTYLADGRFVSDAARELLGLVDASTSLFSPQNSFEQLVNIVASQADMLASDIEAMIDERVTAILNKTPPGVGVHA